MSGLRLIKASLLLGGIFFGQLTYAVESLKNVPEGGLTRSALTLVREKPNSTDGVIQVILSRLSDITDNLTLTNLVAQVRSLTQSKEQELENSVVNWLLKAKTQKEIEDRFEHLMARDKTWETKIVEVFSSKKLEIIDESELVPFAAWLKGKYPNEMGRIKDTLKQRLAVVSAPELLKFYIETYGEHYDAICTVLKNQNASLDAAIFFPFMTRLTLAQLEYILEVANPIDNSDQWDNLMKCFSPEDARRHACVRMLPVSGDTLDVTIGRFNNVFQTQANSSYPRSGTKYYGEWQPDTKPSIQEARFAPHLKRILDVMSKGLDTLNSEEFDRTAREILSLDKTRAPAIAKVLMDRLPAITNPEEFDRTAREILSLDETRAPAIAQILMDRLPTFRSGDFLTVSYNSESESESESDANVMRPRVRVSAESKFDRTAREILSLDKTRAPAIAKVLMDRLPAITNSEEFESFFLRCRAIGAIVPSHRKNIGSVLFEKFKGFDVMIREDLRLSMCTYIIDADPTMKSAVMKHVFQRLQCVRIVDGSVDFLMQFQRSFQSGIAQTLMTRFGRISHPGHYQHMERRVTDEIVGFNLLAPFIRTNILLLRRQGEVALIRNMLADPHLHKNGGSSHLILTDGRPVLPYDVARNIADYLYPQHLKGENDMNISDIHLMKTYETFCEKNPDEDFIEQYPQYKDWYERMVKIGRI